MSWCPGPHRSCSFRGWRSRSATSRSRPRPAWVARRLWRCRRWRPQLGLKSLFTRQAGIKRVVLTRPVVELRVDAQGRRSWDFASARLRHWQAALPVPSGDERPQLIPVSAPAQAQPAADAGNLAATLEMLSPASVRIVEGSVRYLDERSGLRHDVDGARPGARSRRRRRAAAGQGQLRLARRARGRRRQPVVAARAGRGAQGQAIAQARRTAYRGELRRHARCGLPGLALDGNVSLKSPSVQALGSWAGSKPIAAGRDAGALTLSSSLTGGSDRVSLADLTATLGDTQISGALAVESPGGAALCQRHPEAFSARSRRHPDSPELGRGGSARSIEEGCTLRQQSGRSHR